MFEGRDFETDIEIAWVLQIRKVRGGPEVNVVASRTARNKRGHGFIGKI